MVKDEGKQTGAVPVFLSHETLACGPGNLSRKEERTARTSRWPSTCNESRAFDSAHHPLWRDDRCFVITAYLIDTCTSWTPSRHLATGQIPACHVAFAINVDLTVFLEMIGSFFQSGNLDSILIELSGPPFRMMDHAFHRRPNWIKMMGVQLAELGEAKWPAIRRA